MTKVSVKEKDRKKNRKKAETYAWGVRQFRFFYMIGWMAKYWITHRTNPAILSRLNIGLRNGGSCTYPKSEIYTYFIKDNPTAKRYFARCIKIPQGMSWEHVKTALKTFSGKKTVFKPDKGSRSMGVRVVSTDAEKKTLLDKRGKTDYIVQEYLQHQHELGVLYYKYPTWKKGKILGIADRKFEDIVDPKHKNQYTDRPDLITRQLTETFNRIVGDKEIYYCRFDIKAESLERLKDGEGFKIIEANAGPDAVSLHAFDSSYSTRKQLKIYIEDLTHAFRIAEMNAKRRFKGKTDMGLIRYIWLMVKEEIPMQCLRFRLRNIKNNI